MTALQYDDFFESTSNDIDIINLQFKMWTRYDTILCLESSNDKKDGIISTIVSTIKRLIQEAARIIEKGISSLSNHIRYGLLSKKQKEKFNTFQDFINKNPNVKNKNVKVKDWQKIMRTYDKIEKEIVNAMNDDTVDAKGLNMKAHDLLNNMAGLINSATASITVDACLTLARKSPEMAQYVQKCLNSCDAALKNIQNELGQAEANKLQNKLGKLTKESVGQKILALFYQKKEKSITDCISEFTATFEKLMSGDAKVTDKIGAAIEHRDLIRTGAKSYFRNKETRKGVKAVKDFMDDPTVQSVKSKVTEILKPNGK